MFRTLIYEEFTSCLPFVQIFFPRNYKWTCSALFEVGSKHEPRYVLFRSTSDQLITTGTSQYIAHVTLNTILVSLLYDGVS